jgi:hypothetical protein
LAGAWEFIGGAVSAFDDGDALSAFGAAAVGASFMPVPWANAEPVPIINARAAAEPKSEFLMWVSSSGETDNSAGSLIDVGQRKFPLRC